MGHVFVPHFGEPCRSFILGNVSWYVDASGAALHVTWRVLDKRASEQNTVLIRQKNASPSSLRACAARPTILSLPFSLFTIEEEPRERPHQHPREHCVRSDHSLAQLGLHAFHGSACLRNNNAQSHGELQASFFLRNHCITKEGNKKNLEAFARYRECSLDAFHPLMQKREGRHEDRTSGRTQWGWSGACPKRRAVQRRPPRTAP